MNRGELVTRAGRVMGMARSSTDSTPDVALLQQLAQEAIHDILSRTKVHVSRTDLTLTAGVVDYDLSQQVMRLWQLAIDGVPLQEVQESDFDAYEGAHVFQFVGLNMFTIAWTPEEGDAVEALYSPKPTPMDSDDDDPSTATFGLIPVQFHPVIIDYMCWRAGEITRDQLSGMGEKFRRSYEGEDSLGRIGSGLGRIKEEANRRGDTGSQLGRLRGMGERSAADAGSSAWR